MPVYMSGLAVISSASVKVIAGGRGSVEEDVCAGNGA